MTKDMCSKELYFIASYEMSMLLIIISFNGFFFEKDTYNYVWIIVIGFLLGITCITGYRMNTRKSRRVMYMVETAPEIVIKKVENE